MTKITGIDIRKNLLSAGLNPNEFNEEAILRDCIANSIDDWEWEAFAYSNGTLEEFINKYSKMGAMECTECIYRDQVLGLPPLHQH